MLTTALVTLWSELRPPRLAHGARQDELEPCAKQPAQGLLQGLGAGTRRPQARGARVAPEREDIPGDLTRPFFVCTFVRAVKSRSVVIGLVACLVSFGVALAAFLGLASSNAKRPHVHVHFGQAFAGRQVPPSPSEVALLSCLSCPCREELTAWFAV